MAWEPLPRVFDLSELGRFEMGANIVSRPWLLIAAATAVQAWSWWTSLTTSRTATAARACLRQSTSLPALRLS
jgi:hypothetical protein